jgi:putative MATE family efflux protein
VNNNSSNNKETKGVQTLLGDPKKAIIKLSIPMIVAMTVQTLYNLIDTLWVSGLGVDALAAVQFVFPFSFMAAALATGLGIGGGSAISRKIGAKDKQGVDNVASHSMIIMLIISILFMISIFTLAEPIFTTMGAGRTTHTAVAYAQILATGVIFIFFAFMANAILRAEGDAKRAMIAMVLGGVINVILDPIFIYTLGLGVPGAAWATVISMSIPALILFYWLFIKKDTYVTTTLRSFHFNKKIIRDILQVGLPASVMQLSMGIMMIIINLILINVGGIDSLAVFSAGWKVVTIATMPLLGMATAVVSVTGAAYGAKDYKKLKTANIYSIKIGLIFELIIAISTFLLAPYIAMAFTQGEGSERILGDLTAFLQIICIFYPTSAFGIESSAVFQGMGKGIYSLMVTLFRTIILIPPLAWMF